MIELELFGNPVPQPRAKFCRKGSFTTVYDPASKLKEGFAWQLKSQYRGEPLTCPLSVHLLFFMPIPKSTSKTKAKQMANGVIAHTKKPDIDNLGKLIFDVMNGLVYKDDAQIMALHSKKIYSHNPGTYIRVVPLADEKEGLLYENCTRELPERKIY